MAKVVTVLSAGHSGSTLCDILMGTIPGVFSTGECVYFPWQIYRDGGVCEKGHDVCSCGKKFSECETWKRVIELLSEQTGYNLLAHPLSFDMAMLRSPIYGQSPSVVKRTMRKMLLLAMQNITLPTLANLFSSRRISRQLDNNWLFFDTIGKVVTATHIVDSSKDIVRLKFLHSRRPDDVSVVVLVRNILGVAASAYKRGKDPYFEAQRWVKIYQQFVRILRNTENIQLKTIQYKDLAENPERARKDLAKFLGLPSPPNPLQINTTEHHLVAGNPMRYKGDIVIKYDDSWKDVLPGDMRKKIQELRAKYEPISAELESLSQETISCI